MDVDIISLTEQFGPSLGLLFFFLARDYKREERMQNRLDFLIGKLLDGQRKTQTTSAGDDLSVED